MMTGWEGKVIKININNWRRHNSFHDFLDVVQRKGLEDGIEFIRDSLGDQKSFKKGFLHNNVLFNIERDGCGGDNFLIDFNINNLHR